MRINGLLRAFRSVRSRLQAGLGPEELNQLREDVKAIVQSVEQICARHGITPDQLPRPSRRVYKFLTELAAGHLPAGAPTVDRGLPRSRPALRNVRRCGDYLAERLWQQLPRLAKPRLVWNRAITGRKFGHYRPSTDTVMLSVSLDVPEAPASVVDFVMYHELLHKKHGITVVNRRRLAHTSAFRAEERQFAEYGEAERVLNDLARKH